MGSLIPNYEYDIFISYRHNDNLNGGITQFVEELKKELSATIKDSVSIYFDSNAHDGLLENHHVDKSLEGKLKSLIFIPIISQTYCDPKSFAWQHEFVAFNQLSQEDRFGRDIKLNNGNVASRILPIQIHKLDAEDTLTIQNEIGGVLRAIEFIYEEAGVNRPLKLGDSETKNINGTSYHNQVNKVANAIKEILITLKNPNKNQDRVVQPQLTSSTSSKNKKTFVGLALATALIAILSYFLFPKFQEDSVEKIVDKSIAVLPFVNLSNDPEQEYFSDGLSEELLNLLAKNADLEVIARTSSFSFKNKQVDIRTIGETLDVAHILEGSVRRSGEKIRITAKLIKVADGRQLWGETYDTKATDVFEIQDKIGRAIAGNLALLLSKKGSNINELQTTDLTTYELYLKARQKLALRGQSLLEARELFEQVIKRDSKYSPAYSGLARTLSAIPDFISPPFEEGRKLSNLAIEMSQKALEINPNNAEAFSVLGNVKAHHYWKWEEGEKYLLKSVALEPNNSEMLNFLGDYYRTTANPLAIPTELKALNLDPLHPIKYTDLALSYFYNGETLKAIDCAARAIKLDSSLLNGYSDVVRYLIEEREFDQAERHINMLSKLNTHQSNLRIIEHKTRIAIAKGQKEIALELLEQLKGKIPESTNVVLFVAQLYALLEMWVPAEEYFQKSYDMKQINFRNILLFDKYPDNSPIHKILNKPGLNELFEIRIINEKQ